MVETNVRPFAVALWVRKEYDNRVEKLLELRHLYENRSAARDKGQTPTPGGCEEVCGLSHNP